MKREGPTIFPQTRPSKRTKAMAPIPIVDDHIEPLLEVQNHVSTKTARIFELPKDASKVSFEEYRDCTELTHDWADSYDRKDWDQLAGILAPTVKINYASVNDYRNDALPAEEFVAMTSSMGFLGDPDLDTQHLMGACKLRKVSEDEILGTWQIRAGHQRYRDVKLSIPGIDRTTTTHKGTRTVLLTGHSQAHIMLTYKKVNGEWKWGGITTDIRWNEAGFDKMFTGFEAGKAP